MNSLRPITPPPAEERAELAVSVIAGREYRSVTVPRTNVTGAMRLLSRKENAEVRFECRRSMEERGITGIAVENFTEWHEELAVRSIAIAMRSESNHEAPLARLCDWLECDDDQINALWERYQDLEAELDPLGDKGPPLSDADMTAIVAAAKKKSLVLLTSYGSRKLARSLISLVDLPSS